MIHWHTHIDGFEAGARTLQFAALSFDVSFQEMFSTWRSGGTLVLVDEENRNDFEALSGYLTASAVNRLYLPPIALIHLADAATSANAYPQHSA